MDNKICTKCKEEKLLDEFCKNKNKKDGYGSWCKNCDKNYKNSRKNETKIYDKIYKECHKNEAKEYFEQYYELNYLDFKKRSKEWTQNNPQQDKINKLRFIENNPNYSSLYYLDNKKEHIMRCMKRDKIRVQEDPLYRLSKNIRNLIGGSFKNNLNGKYSKSKKSKEILECNILEFIKYIESKLEYWMTVNNYGNPKDNIFEPNKTWDLDHIIPISSAKTEEDLYRLNHYTNFQPLCSYYNRFIKKNKII